MNRWVRGILLALLAVVVVIVLFTQVFPWVESQLITNPVVGG